MIRSVIALVFLSICVVAKAGNVENNIQDSSHGLPFKPRTLCSEAIVRPSPLNAANPTLSKPLDIPVDVVYKVAKIAIGSQAPDLSTCAH